MGIEGVIRPPPEIRAVADKTASYVAKNGRAFEARILGSGKGKTPKFAFLHESSPFHAYYEERIRFYEDGGEDEKNEETEKEEKNKQQLPKKESMEEEKKEETAAKTKKKRDEKSQKSGAAIDPVAKALLAQRAKIAQGRAKFNEEASKEPHKTGEEEEGDAQPVKKKLYYTPPAPPSLELVNIVAPSSLTIAQVETIQLVAQFTALDGKGGPFFANLSRREWANPTFAFCQPRHGHFAYFSALVDAYRHVYESWSNSLKGDSVHEMAGNVDRCLELAAYRVEYDRYLEEQTRKQRAEDGGEIPEIAQIDWHDFVVVETIDFSADEKVEMMLPPPPAPKSSNAADEFVAVGATATTGAVGDVEESDEEESEQIRVVPTYKPKVMSTKQSYSSDEVIDPITGRSVPIKDMPEHMRIQLLDPKWAEERKKFQEKQKDSNLVSGDMIASNISKFSSQAFANTGNDLLSGEADPRRRLEEANRTIREQSQRDVGPSLPPPAQPAADAPPPPPPPPPPPLQKEGQVHPADSRPAMSEEPAAKRQRVDDSTAATGQVEVPSHDTMPTEPMADAAIPAESAEQELLPEEEFIRTLSKPEVTLQVRVPNDPIQMAWNFYGQILSLSVDVKSKVKAVKEELSKTHLNGMPPNKIQLKGAGGFLKDSKTLASLNIGPTATVEVRSKTRGGRK